MTNWGIFYSARTIGGESMVPPDREGRASLDLPDYFAVTLFDWVSCFGDPNLIKLGVCPSNVSLVM